MQSYEVPYFMNDDAWWYKGEDGQIQIRDDAPRKARESYEKWVHEGDQYEIDDEREAHTPGRQ